MNNWIDLVARPSDTLKTAIKIIDRNTIKIVLVVDESNKLIGTVTDGDIRRALLRHLQMDSLISAFMNNDPITAKNNDGQSFILSVMKKNEIMQIPTIDDNEVVTGIVSLNDIVSVKARDNPIFLMAGGFGKRLEPLTNHIPKPLLKVGNKAILEIILERFIEFGFNNFYISTHYKSELIKAHFGNGEKWGVSINYVSEEKPLGTAGSLSLLPKFDKSVPIIMMNGDILTKIDLKELVDFHSERKANATMCVREYDFTVPYGVVTANKGLVVDIVEKPIHKFFINAGIYVLNPEIISMVPNSSFLDMPNLLEKVVQTMGNVNVFPTHEYWLDIGQMDHFKKAQVDVGIHFNA